MKINNSTLFQLLPLLVYFIGDLFLPSFISSVLAIGLVLLEMGYGYFKQGKIESFYYVELAILGLFTMVDFLVVSDGLIYKELFYGLIIIIPIVIAKVLRISLLNLLFGRFSNQFQLNSFQKVELGRQGDIIFKILVVGLLILSILQIYTFIYNQRFDLSKIGYISLFFLFISLFIDARIRARGFKKETWVPILKDDGSVECYAPRSIVHAKTFLLHPVVHLHVVNSEGIYLQKRPITKLIQPGKWDTAVGGHVDAGENILQALYRETKEEIGIDLQNEYFVNSYEWKSRVEREHVFTYICFWNGEIYANSIELDGGRFWSFKEITDNLENDIFTPNFIHEFPWIKGLAMSIISNKNVPMPELRK